ncbi:hypothetical protein, partial [Aliivibrio salmonicida]|uniref:hypothetical protein n=1 Tax=Aliivibrio salmonicida TaxID=40269 RepID=UPI003D11D78D
VFMLSCVNICNEKLFDENGHVESLPVFIATNNPKFIKVKFKIYVNSYTDNIERNIDIGKVYSSNVFSSDDIKISKGAVEVLSIIKKSLKNRNFLLDLHMREPLSTYRVEFGRFGRRIIKSDKIESVLYNGEVYKHSPDIVSHNDKVNALTSPKDDIAKYTEN